VSSSDLLWSRISSRKRRHIGCAFTMIANVTWLLDLACRDAISTGNTWTLAAQLNSKFTLIRISTLWLNKLVLLPFFYITPAFHRKNAMANCVDFFLCKTMAAEDIRLNWDREATLKNKVEIKASYWTKPIRTVVLCSFSSPSLSPINLGFCSFPVYFMHSTVCLYNGS